MFKHILFKLKNNILRISDIYILYILAIKVFVAARRLIVDVRRQYFSTVCLTYLQWQKIFRAI